MNSKLKRVGVHLPKVLLPKSDVEYTKWATIACDQFTSDKKYWDSVNEYVNTSPSALKVTLPEIYLKDDVEKRISDINSEMERYIKEGVLFEACEAPVYIERETSSGIRRGLLVLLDLEMYDFNENSISSIRATEGTILSRIPPRVAIRKDALLELPHIMVLIDDPEKKVIEPIGGKKAELRPLYDFDLMEGGGHISGFAVENEKIIDDIANALIKLDDAVFQRRKYRISEDNGAMTFAVGDGNHSLATAKTVWDSVKEDIPTGLWDTCPQRYAMVEINNLHDESLIFEPIHRVIMGVEPEEFMRDFSAWAKGQVMNDFDPQTFICVYKGGEIKVTVPHAPHSLPVGTLQGYLDDYIQRTGAEIDYIHDDDALRELAQADGAVGFLLPPIPKDDFFRSILLNGPLPRKTFSMGHARDKRYYLEARKIK